MWEDVEKILKAVNEMGGYKLILVAFCFLVYKVGKPIMDAWLLERKALLQDLEDARKEAVLLASNHVAHLQDAVEAANKSFQDNQKQIVDGLDKVASAQAQTVQALEHMNHNMEQGFEGMKDTFRDVNKD